MAVKWFYFVLAISGGAVFGWGFTKSMEAVLLENDPRGELPPCFEVGAPFHHRFRPNCVGELKTPRGPKPFSVNEDGLRELPRPHVLKSEKRVLVMGDSYVEGWWASQEESLSSLLRERFPGIFFINGGGRSTGPVMQAERLRELLRVYRPQGVIWFLNDTDSLDDRFACAIAENPDAPAGQLRFGTPEFELGSWQSGLASLLGSTASGQRLRRRFYLEKWISLAEGESALRCDACRGVRNFKQLLKEADLPLLTFYLFSSEGLAHTQYSKGGSLRLELFSCLEESGIQAIAAGLKDMSAEEVERYVWEGDFHFNPEGIAMLTAQVVPTVEKWLKPAPLPVDGRGRRRVRP